MHGRLTTADVYIEPITGNVKAALDFLADALSGTEFQEKKEAEYPESTPLDF